MGIDCVFFDYDGVLTTDATGSTSTCRYVSATCGVPLDHVKSAFTRHNRALTLGQLTHEAVWAEICAAIGQALPLQVLTDAFDSTPANRPMFDLARRLRPTCRVAIITDNKLDRMRRLKAVQQLDKLFDPIIVSAEEGLSKASGDLFERALARAGVQPTRSVLIDNDRENVAVAAACGVHAIHFDHVSNDAAFRQAVIDKLTHENAILKRLKFAASSEAFNTEQRSLLEETLDADLAAVAAEIEALGSSKPQGDKQQAKRQPLPPHLPRREIHHEPEDTTCGCGQPMQRIGEDVAEKLDYQPGSFTVERHVRGKWVCKCCEKLVQPRSHHMSSTRACPPPGCSPRYSWPSTSITCRCIGRKRSSSAPGT